MNNQEYKKTYKPLIAWLIGFPIITTIIVESFFDISTKASVLSSLIIMVISLYVLMMLKSFLYGAVSLLLVFPTWVDILLITLLIIITVFSTISIKLNKK